MSVVLSRVPRPWQFVSNTEKTNVACQRPSQPDDERPPSSRRSTPSTRPPSRSLPISRFLCPKIQAALWQVQSQEQVSPPPHPVTSHGDYLSVVVISGLLFPIHEADRAGGPPSRVNRRERQREVRDVLEVLPWPIGPDHLGLEEAEDRLGQHVVVRAAQAADRRCLPTVRSP
jgi:hypothetical protein